MRILIAEDEEDILLSYQLALQNRGHVITTTCNGLQCLEEYKSRYDPISPEPPFDVVLLDYRMPVMNGYEAAKAILRLRPDQRIVFASAYSKETIQELIKKDGVIAELLQKPFGLEVLRDTLEDKYIYTRLQQLRVNIGDLHDWKPTHKQLSDLLDGVLRLKDPKTIFDELLSNKINEQKSVSHHRILKRSTDMTKDCSNRVIAIVEEGVKFLGQDSLSVFYYHLDRLGVKREDIPANPELFMEALDKMFGAASSMIQSRILMAMEENQDLISGDIISAKFLEVLRKLKCLPTGRN
jgi:two-component system chemotaxis response regulator CheY/two-component system cell cycle response regulator CpdR